MNHKDWNCRYCQGWAIWARPTGTYIPGDNSTGYEGFGFAHLHIPDPEGGIISTGDKLGLSRNGIQTPELTICAWVLPIPMMANMYYIDLEQTQKGRLAGFMFSFLQHPYNWSTGEVLCASLQTE